MLSQRLGQSRDDQADSSPLEATLLGAELSREAFDDLMAALDQGLRALPATGQVGFCGLSNQLASVRSIL